MEKLLSEHGTKLADLPPSAIVSTAKADLKRRQRNIERAQNGEFGFERYAFLAKHVRKANSPEELIGKALEQRLAGSNSNNLNRRLLYADEEILQQALARAKTSQDLRS